MYDTADSGDLSVLLRTYTSNMEKAGQCKARHDSLADFLEKLGEEK